MLRRRRDAQAQALRQAEGRQEAHAPVRQGRYSAGGVYRGAEGGCVMSMDISSLGKKVPDRIAVALRSAVSLIPVAGGLLAEIISEIIPNQRLDRVENFLLALTTE